MPVPAVAALADDPTARVVVFVDGQNLYHRCKALYGHPLCHPHLLAEYLAGSRTRHRIACRFYTGVPSPNEPGERTKRRNLDRRLAGMRKVGVTVVTRPLRYHDAWGIDDPLPGPNADTPSRVVRVSPYRRAQEKGIDLALALDVVEFALTGVLDVAIVVSFDRDLHEIPRAVRNLRGSLPGPVRIEAAVPVAEGRRRPIILDGFDYTHQVPPSVFAYLADRTDYTVEDERWIPVEPPRSLQDVGFRGR